MLYLAPDVPVPFPSGASVHVSELAGSLHELGHEVHTVSRRTARSSPSYEVRNGVVVHRVYRFMFFPQAGWSRPGGSDDRERTGAVGRMYYLYLSTIFALFVALYSSRLIKRHGIDVVIERETAFGAGGIASFISGRPLILEIVGPRYSKVSAEKSRYILYYTDSMLRSWVDRRKCVPVPAGVDVTLFHPDYAAGRETRRSLDLRETDVVVGYVGTFQDWHGVDTLLMAVAGIKPGGPRLRLVLVGPATDALKALAKRLGLADACTFVGPLDYADVPRFVNACDIMVAPYNPGANPLRKQYGLGWPLKILEYMACGKPVVSTNVEPVPRIVANPALGLLVDPGDDSKLRQAILELARDGTRSREIGMNGRRLVESGYSWTPLARNLSSLVEKA